MARHNLVVARNTTSEEVSCEVNEYFVSENTLYRCADDRISIMDPYENEKWKQWAAQWTGAAHCLCKLIIISAHGLHMGSSVDRSCPLTFNLIIISDHGLPMGSSDR